MKWLLFFLIFVLSQNARAVVPATTAERCVQHYATQYGVPPELIGAFIDGVPRLFPNALSC